MIFTQEVKEAEEGKRYIYEKMIELAFIYSASDRACPECYAPVGLGRKDGRCDLCLHDKFLLPVNHIRTPKKKSEEDEDDE